MDGVHVGQYFARLEEVLNEPGIHLGLKRS